MNNVQIAIQLVLFVQAGVRHRDLLFFHALSKADTEFKCVKTNLKLVFENNRCGSKRVP